MLEIEEQIITEIRNFNDSLTVRELARRMNKSPIQMSWLTRSLIDRGILTYRIIGSAKVLSLGVKMENDTKTFFHDLLKEIKEKIVG